jgi:hypothetical protein
MNDPNPYESPHHSGESQMETNDDAVATLSQTRLPVAFLGVAAGLFVLHRLGMIAYTILRLTWVQVTYALQYAYFRVALGMDIVFIVGEAALCAILCRSLLRYLAQVRAIQQGEQTSLNPLFAVLKSVWATSAILVAVVVVQRIAEAVFAGILPAR